MPAAGVLDHLHQRLEILVEHLREQTRPRIAAPKQCARDGVVEVALDSLLQSPGIEAMEVGALPAEQVDDLNVIAFLHVVGARGGVRNLEIGDQIRQRIGQFRNILRARRGARNPRFDFRRGILGFGRHRASGRGDDEDPGTLCHELGSSPRRGVAAEQPRRARGAKVDAALLEGGGDGARVLRCAGKDRAQAFRWAIRLAPIKPGSMRPAASAASTSQGCRPSTSMSVIRSPGAIERTAAPPPGME